MSDSVPNNRIAQAIDTFLAKALKLRDARSIARYFRFMRKVPDRAPFNNALVFIQNPSCGYYATAREWETRFHRTVKKGARPMVILCPFGPVDFVFDYRDTEGDDFTDDHVLFWWRQHGGTLDKEMIGRTRANLRAIGIEILEGDPRTYFEKHSFRTGGVARRDRVTGDVSIALHPRYDVPDAESYGVLCHEIAHILLGHLGEIVLRRKIRAKTIEKKITRNRGMLPTHVREIESELVAWIVMGSLGIEKNSASYVATWLTGQDDIARIGMSDVLRVAGKIQDMGKRRNVFF
jgi:hypothetical protein